MCVSGFLKRGLAALGLLVSALSIPPPNAARLPQTQAAASRALTGNHDRLAMLHSLPQPEPLIFAALPVDKARLINAAIPFATSLGPASRPFAFSGTDLDRERAVDCLASAMWYEAGNDERGQRSVGQVILNRVRHPAFPANVCGVVFQGAERRTGCQFTFTCDGALQRTPSLLAFTRARATARSMLNGSVDSEVGLATHYHTDWVHPVWSAEMEKLARVGTHLFFRWKGDTTLKSLSQGYGQSEAAIAKLAGLSVIHRIGLDGGLPAAPLPDTGDAATISGASLAMPSGHALAERAGQSSAALRLAVSLGDGPRAPANAALGMCGDQPYCKVVGSGPSGEIAFLYVRDQRTGVEQLLWDCTAFPRRNPAQCLDAGSRRWIGFDGSLRAAKPPESVLASR